jgi:hypothetical protein
MAPAPAHALLDYHTDRLTRLEDQAMANTAQLAANTVGLEALGEKVTTAFTSLDHQLQAMHIKLDTIGTTLVQHEVRVQALESSRKDRKAWILGVLSALAVLLSKYLLGL